MAFHRVRRALASWLRTATFLLFAGAALITNGCQPETILCTISCPVYQPPQTPMPEWPKPCGGTRDVACSSDARSQDGRWQIPKNISESSAAPSATTTSWPTAPYRAARHG